MDKSITRDHSYFSQVSFHAGGVPPSKGLLPSEALGVITIGLELAKGGLIGKEEDVETLPMGGGIPDPKIMASWVCRYWGR